LIRLRVDPMGRQAGSDCMLIPWAVDTKQAGSDCLDPVAMQVGSVCSMWLFVFSKILPIKI